MNITPSFQNPLFVAQSTPASHTRHWFRLIFFIGALAAGAVLAACSSSSPAGGSGGATGGGGSTGQGDAPYKPCTDANRVGQFTLELKHAADNAPAYSQVNGRVRDSVDPKDVWTELMKSGDCRVMVGPSFTCAPACGTGNVCKAGACVPAPVSHSVGMVNVTGLVISLPITPNSSNNSYYGPVPTGTATPPYTVGAAVGLMAAGGDYTAFALTARGIEPIEAPESQALPLKASANPALTVKWNAAPAGGTGRVVLSLDIAHHGGVAAELICDVADTGTAAIPGALVDALVARGTAGFPEISITRMSVDSTTLAPGCVEFGVAASISRSLMVEGVKSCTDNANCTAPQTCLPSLKCG